MNICDELIKRGAYHDSVLGCFVLTCAIGYLCVFQDAPNELGLAFYDNSKAGFIVNAKMPTQIDSAISLLGGVKQ